MQVVSNMYMYMWYERTTKNMHSFHTMVQTLPLPSWEVHEDPPLAYRRSMQLLLLPSRSSMQLIPLLSRRSIHPSFFPLGRSRSWTIAWNKRLSYKAWLVQHDKSHLKVMQQAQPSRHVVIVAITQSGRYFSLTLII